MTTDRSRCRTSLGWRWLRCRIRTGRVPSKRFAILTVASEVLPALRLLTQCTDALVDLVQVPRILLYLSSNEAMSMMVTMVVSMMMAMVSMMMAMLVVMCDQSY